MSISPGVTSAPDASITSVASPVSVSATAATLPPLSATSRLAEIDCAGSTSVPPRMSRSQVGAMLLRERSAVDDELAAGHVRRVVRSEIEHRVDDLGHRPHSPQRHSLQPSLQRLLVGNGAVEHLGVDRARMHGVAADLVLGVLAGRDLREDPNGALAGGVRGLLVQ